MSGKDDKWEFYKDKRGEHRWRRRATNGNIVGAATEGYKGKKSCTDNAERHGYNGNPNKHGRDDKWEFYKDKSGGNRWRRRSSHNNEITGASSESYKAPKDSKENARRNGYTG